MVKFKVDDSNYNKIYPIGSIYMSINETNPSELFGGEWEQIQDKFLLASGSTYSAGSTGGSADSVVVTHNHYGSEGRGFVTNTEKKDISQKRVTVPTSGSNYAPIITSSDNWYSVSQVGNTGESGTGKNMPPYLAVYCWVRIA